MLRQIISIQTTLKYPDLGTTTTIGIVSESIYIRSRSWFRKYHYSRKKRTASGTIAYNELNNNAGDSIGWIGISSTFPTHNATGGIHIQFMPSHPSGNFVIHGTMVKNYSIFVVGGGGGGWDSNGYAGGGGGGGGIAYHPAVPLVAGTYALSVGAGGAGGTNNTTGGNAGERFSLFDPTGSYPFVLMVVVLE